MAKTKKKQNRFKSIRKAKFHVLSYRLNDDEYVQLKELSLATGDFISTITRMAVKFYLEKAPK